VGFVVDKVELGQVFSDYFGFLCKSSFHKFSTITITSHPELVQLASSDRSTQSPTTQIKKKKNRPISGRSVEWTQLVPPPTIQIKKVGVLLISVFTTTEMYLFFGRSNKKYSGHPKKHGSRHLNKQISNL
jgi:hypothetical protein